MARFSSVAFVSSGTPDAEAALTALCARYPCADPEHADVVVALGGDGLMLQTQHRFLGSGKLMLMSDTTNHPALFVRHPEWQAVFDMDGNQAVETRRKLLDMAASERARVAFYHAPFPATGYIAKGGSGYEFVPVQWSSAI